MSKQDNRSHFCLVQSRDFEFKKGLLILCLFVCREKRANNIDFFFSGIFLAELRSFGHPKVPSSFVLVFFSLRNDVISPVNWCM